MFIMVNNFYPVMVIDQGKKKCNVNHIYSGHALSSTSTKLS